MCLSAFYQQIDPVTKFSTITGLALSMGLLVIASLPAFSAAPARMSPGAAANAAQVSDAQLHEFAAAYRAVTAIRKKLLIETHTMDDQAKVDKLQSQAEEKMKAAILSHMSLGEYVRIGKAVNENRALRARFMRLRAETDKPPAPASS